MLCTGLPAAAALTPPGAVSRHRPTCRAGREPLLHESRERRASRSLSVLSLRSPKLAHAGTPSDVSEVLHAMAWAGCSASGLTCARQRSGPHAVQHACIWSAGSSQRCMRRGPGSPPEGGTVRLRWGARLQHHLGDGCRHIACSCQAARMLGAAGAWPALRCCPCSAHARRGSAGCGRRSARACVLSLSERPDGLRVHATARLVCCQSWLRQASIACACSQPASKHGAQQPGEALAGCCTCPL